MPDTLLVDIRDHPARESFFALSRQVFGLDFAPWHAQGYWTNRYIPYALVRDGRVLANASANIIDTRFNGQPKRFIQVGTVMTHPDFRGQGLISRTLTSLLSDWRERCDAIYLYANDTVLDFYPRFGFERAQEYSFSRPITPVPGDFIQLDMNRPENVALLRSLYAQGNGYAQLPMLNNFGLLMFYCGFFLKENVFYSPNRATVCIAAMHGDTLALSDVFGASDIPLTRLASELASSGVRHVSLGFTPLTSDGFDIRPLREEDSTLYVLSNKENVFARARVRMPELSHA